MGVGGVATGVCVCVRVGKGEGVGRGIASVVVWVGAAGVRAAAL